MMTVLVVPDSVGSLLDSCLNRKLTHPCLSLLLEEQKSFDENTLNKKHKEQFDYAFDVLTSLTNEL